MGISPIAAVKMATIQPARCYGLRRTIIVGVESSKTYKSNETGEIEQNAEVVKCGKVLAVGPACKNVEVGDDVYYTTYSEAKLPFRKKGYVIVGEGLLICRIVKKK